MMNKKGNYARLGHILKIGQEIHNNKLIEIDDLFNNIRNGVNEIYKFEKEIETIKEENLIIYLNRLEKTIAELNNKNIICAFLNAEKKECHSKQIKATIQKNAQDVEYYQTAIDNILNPLYNYWKYEHDFKLEFKPVKETPINENLIEPEISVSPLTNMINSTPIIVSEEIKTQFDEGLNLPEGFMQINIKDLSAEKILKYFNRLAIEKNNINYEPYMTEQDVVELVNNNFTVFQSQPTGKSFVINLHKNQKIRLRYFIQRFYQRYERNPHGSKMKYVYFLIHNFDLFKDDKPENLYKNMGDKKKPIEENIIPVDK